MTLRNLGGEGKTSRVMRFVVAQKEREESSVPEKLAPDLDFPDPADVEITRRFRFIAGVGGGMSAINRKVFDPERIDANALVDMEMTVVAIPPSGGGRGRLSAMLYGLAHPAHHGVHHQIEVEPPLHRLDRFEVHGDVVADAGRETGLYAGKQA